MTREVKPILAVLAGVVVIVGLVLAMRPGTSETTVLPPVTLGDPIDVEPSAAIVVSKFQSEGTSILWMNFGRTTHRLSVQFYAPPGCSDLVTFDDPWPAPFDECTTDLPIVGSISGLGIAPTQESIVAVEVEVTEECFDRVPRGASWPPDATECTEPVA